MRRFVFGAEVEGVFTLFALQFFFIGIVLFGVGLMGEYVGRIQQEVRGRPRYRISAVLEARAVASDRQAASRPAVLTRMRAVVFAYSNVGDRCLRVAARARRRGERWS